MNAWGIFAFLYNGINAPLLSFVNTMITTVAGAVMPPLLTGVTIWIGGMSAMDLFHSNGGDPLMALVRRLIRSGIVIGLADAATYTQIFGTFVLTTLPDEITAMIAQAANGAAAAVNANAYDILINQSWVSLTQIWNNLSNWSVKSIIMGVFAGIDVLIGAVLIAVSFVVYVASHLLLGFAIAIGPLFVGFLLWEKTIPWFNGWIGVLASTVLIQVLLVALMAFMAGVQTNNLAAILALNAANGTNANDIGSQIHYLFDATAIYLIIGVVAMQIPAWASAITGTLAPGISQISQMAYGALASSAGPAARGAIGAADAVARPPASAGDRSSIRSLRPPGRAA
jgi:type IV secretion system protein VirB6